MVQRKAVLIIGANGILGSAIIDELHKFGFITIGTTRHNAKTSATYTLHAPDLSLESCKSLFRDLQGLMQSENLEINLVIELAAICYPDTAIAISPEKHEEMWNVNVYCPKFWALAFRNVHHILFSSCAVYGVDKAEGLHWYVTSKRTVEYKMRFFCSELTIVRPVIVATQFYDRACLPTPNTNGFPTPQKVAKETVYKGFLCGRRLVLPGIRAKVLHTLNLINPKLAQSFLRVKV